MMDSMSPFGLSTMKVALVMVQRLRLEEQAPGASEDVDGGFNFAFGLMCNGSAPCDSDRYIYGHELRRVLYIRNGY